MKRDRDRVFFNSSIETGIERDRHGNIDRDRYRCRDDMEIEIETSIENHRDRYGHGDRDRHA